MKDTIAAIIAERERQDAKWGPENIINRAAEWGLVVLMEEVGEAANAVLEARAAVDEAVADTWTAAARKELIEVATVAVAMIEAIDNRRYDHGGER